jgi:hypothetical protein
MNTENTYTQKNLQMTLALLSIIASIIILLSWFFHLFGGLGSLFLFIVKIVLILLGVIALLALKNKNQVATIGAVLIVVGGVFALLSSGNGGLGAIFAIAGGLFLTASFKNTNISDLGVDDIKTSIDDAVAARKDLDIKDIKEVVDTGKATLTNVKKEDFDKAVNEVKDNVKDIDIKNVVNKTKNTVEQKIDDIKDDLNKK